MLFLNPGLKFFHTGTGFQKWFPDTLDELEYNPESEGAPQVEKKNKGKLDLDTYDFVALPMLCVKELLADYDDYLASDDLSKDLPHLWIRPRLKTMRKVFEVIDSRFDELTQMTGKKLTAMQKSGAAPWYSPTVVNHFNAGRFTPNSLLSLCTGDCTQSTGMESNLLADSPPCVVDPIQSLYGMTVKKPKTLCLFCKLQL